MRNRRPPEPAEVDRIPDVVARLTDTDVDRRERRRLMGRLTTPLARSGRAAGLSGMVTGRWLTDLVEQVSPHLPIRDLDALVEHHGGRTGEELAEALVRNAARSSAAVGAAGGALAAVEWAAPPALLSAPVQLTAETLAVVAIEVKLIAELQEVYRLPVAGSPRQRATAWSRCSGATCRRSARC
jgi:hypothetical protein